MRKKKSENVSGRTIYLFISPTINAIMLRSLNPRAVSLRKLSCHHHHPEASTHHVILWGTSHRRESLARGTLEEEEDPFLPGETKAEAYTLLGNNALFTEGLSLASLDVLYDTVSRFLDSDEWSLETKVDFSCLRQEATVLALPGHMVDLASWPAVVSMRNGEELYNDEYYVVHRSTGVGILWWRGGLRMDVPVVAEWDKEVEPILRKLLPISPEPVPPLLYPVPVQSFALNARELKKMPLEQPRAFRLADAEKVMSQPNWLASPKPDGIRAELRQRMDDEGCLHRAMRGRDDHFCTRPELNDPMIIDALASLGNCRLDGELVANYADGGAMVFVVFRVSQLNGDEIMAQNAIQSLKDVSELLRDQRWIVCKNWARPGADFAQMVSRYEQEEGVYNHADGIRYPIDGWIFQQFHFNPTGEPPLKFKDIRHLNLDLGIDLDRKEAFYYAENGTRVSLPDVRWNLHDELRVARRLGSMPQTGELCCEFARRGDGYWYPLFVRVKRPNAAATVRDTIATIQDHWPEHVFLKRMSKYADEESEEAVVRRSAHYNRIASSVVECGLNRRQPYRDYQNWIKAYALQMAIMKPKWREGQVDMTRRVLEIGGGKGGDVNKYVKSMKALRRRYHGNEVKMHWYLSDPAYATDASPLLTEAKRRLSRLNVPDQSLMQATYIGMGIEDVLWHHAFPTSSLTNVSAMFVLNYVVSSEEKAFLYLRKIYNLLQPGGCLSLCITDSDTICDWHETHLQGELPQVEIEGSPTRQWGSRYTPTIEGDVAGVKGLEEYVIPHQAFLKVAKECGFTGNPILNANHADFKYDLSPYCNCTEGHKRAIDDQMCIPRLYRVMVMEKPRAGAQRGTFVANNHNRQEHFHVPRQGGDRRGWKRRRAGKTKAGCN